MGAGLGGYAPPDLRAATQAGRLRGRSRAGNYRATPLDASRARLPDDKQAGEYICIYLSI